MQQITYDEAQEQLLELIAAALKGDEVFISGPDHQFVQLVPATPPQRRPQFGSAQGQIVIADDFDDPLPEFEEYTR